MCALRFRRSVDAAKTDEPISGIPMVYIPPSYLTWLWEEGGYKPKGLSDYTDFNGLYRFYSKILMIFSKILKNPHARNIIQNRELGRGGV